MLGSSAALNQFDGIKWTPGVKSEHMNPYKRAAVRPYGVLLSGLGSQSKGWGHPGVPTPVYPAFRAFGYLGDNSIDPQPGAGIQTDITGGANLAQSISSGNASGIVQSAGTIASGALTTAAGFGADWATAAIPIVGPIIAGVTVGLTALFGTIAKHHKQDVITTQVVNYIEPKLQANLQGYLSGPHNYSAQQQAIQNFYAGWNFVLANCPTQANGDAGQRCVNERKEGANPPWAVCAPNCPNWFTLYLDPIRNDPNVVPDSTTTAVVNSNGSTGSILGSSSMLPLLLGGGLILFALMGDSK